MRELLASRDTQPHGLDARAALQQRLQRRGMERAGERRRATCVLEGDARPNVAQELEHRTLGRRDHGRAAAFRCRDEMLRPGRFLADQALAVIGRREPRGKPCRKVAVVPAVERQRSRPGAWQKTMPLERRPPPDVQPRQALPQVHQRGPELQRIARSAEHTARESLEAAAAHVGDREVGRDPEGGETAGRHRFTARDRGEESRQLVRRHQRDGTTTHTDRSWRRRRFDRSQSS